MIEFMFCKSEGFLYLSEEVISTAKVIWTPEHLSRCLESGSILQEVTQ